MPLDIMRMVVEYIELETVLKNKDTLKAILANAEYICRQMIFEDVVEINP